MASFDENEVSRGWFELTRDVENPHPDRRYKHSFWERPVWKAGLRFELIERTYIVDLPTTPVRGIKTAKSAVQWEHRDESGKRVKLFVDNSRPVQDDLGIVFRRHDAESWNLKCLLAVFIETGKLTLADVDAGFSAIMNYDNFALEDLERKHGLQNPSDR